MRLFHLFAFVVVFGLAGCDEAPQNAQSMEMAGRSVAAGGMAPMKVSADMAQMAPPSSMVMDRSQFPDRRIAENHNLTISLGYADLAARYQRDVKACLAAGCELMNSNLQSESSAFIEARVSPDKLGAFLDGLAEGPGKIDMHQVRLDDHTLEYSDVKARLDNMTALRDRLRGLLASTDIKDVENILRVESELARVQGELDAHAARLKILDKMTALSTVTIQYQVDYVPVQMEAHNFATLWDRALQGFVTTLDRLVMFVMTSLPWIPVSFGFAWLAVRMVRFALRGSLGLGWRWPFGRQKGEG